MTTPAHHAHDLLYGSLLLALVFGVIAAMVWDVCWRQFPKAQHEAALDELWADDDDEAIAC